MLRLTRAGKNKCCNATLLNEFYGSAVTVSAFQNTEEFLFIGWIYPNFLIYSTLLNQIPRHIY